MEQQKKLNNVTISYNSGNYTLEIVQALPVSKYDAWKFFTQPENLSKITPPKMAFKITSGKPEQMYAGQIITYKINLFPGFKSSWITEITQVNEFEYFIDEQRFGPYKMWHHEHRFINLQSGILMKDKVSYRVPFGFLGKIAHVLFIKRKLVEIFSFRNQKLEHIFNNKKMKIA